MVCKIITNKYCDDYDKLGRNIKSISDNYCISNGFSILKGYDGEVNKMINVINEYIKHNLNLNII